MTFISLCAGIEGFGKGFEMSGMTCVAQVEIDKRCRSVLARHFPNVLRLDDIRTAGRKNLPKADVICAGTPCQDLSVAGKRGGLKGERSGLFFEFIRIVRELRPSFAVWENVMGCFSSNAGRDFAAVIRAFRECGARDIGWRVLDAQYLGVAQRRERVFVVADFRARRVGKILFDAACMCGNPPTRSQAGKGVAATLRRRSSNRGVSAPGRGGEDDQNIIPALCASGRGTERAGESRGQDPVIVVPNISPAIKSRDFKGPSSDGDGDGAALVVAHTLRADGFDASEDGTGRRTPLVAIPILEAGARTGKLPHKNPSIIKQGVRRLTPREAERLQGFPDDWTLLDDQGKVIADGPRYRMLGNAVCVKVSEWIGRRLMESAT